MGPHSWLTLLLSFCSLISLQAQTFQRTYGGSAGDIGTCIQHTPDGNYVLGAITGSFNALLEDVYLMKVDPSGNLLWSKRMGGNGYDQCYDVEVCRDSGFILTGGYSSSSMGQEVALIRTDAAGNVLWQKYFGTGNDDYGWSVRELSDGSFVIDGFSYSSSTNWDGFILKTDSAGNLLWSKRYGGTGNDDFYGMSLTPDGGFIVTGTTNTFTFGNTDIWLLKLDANGDTLWTKQYGIATEDAGNMVVPTADGGYAIAGDIHSTTTPGAHNAALIKTDSAGNLQWVKAFGANPGAEILYDLLQADDKGYVLLGSTNSYGSGTKDIMLIRTDSMGSLDWARAYGDSLQEDGWFLIPETDKGFTLAGATESNGAGLWDVFLVRTDSAGKTSCDGPLIQPGEWSPVLQTARGIPAGTGLTAHNFSMSIASVSTLVSDPCSTLGVEEEDADPLEVFIYPDPFHVSAELRSTRSWHNARLVLMDLRGRIVYQAEMNGTALEIRTEGLQPGLYFYWLTDESGHYCSGKIMAE